MFPASTKGGGTCMTTGPIDVCKVPAPPAPFVPAPFPNIAQAAQASGTSSKVKICGSQTVTVKSEIPMSSGDEPGTLGGMISAQFKGKVAYKKGSGKVKAEGNAVCHLTSMTAHNGNNANAPAGMQIAPSQVKVIVAP